MSRASNLAGFTTAIGVPPSSLNLGVITATSFSGSVDASNLTGTLPAISGVNLTNIPAGQLTGTVADARISTLTASKLTGALPAIDGSNLTGLSAGGVSDNSTGADSFGLGPNALNSETSGNYNTALGDDALTDLTSGQFNTGIGAAAGKKILDGSQNTCIGSYAAWKLTDGDENTIIGYNSGSSLTLGNSNTVVGRQALVSLALGNFNVAIGHEAGDALTSGSNNIIIGNASDASSTTVSNELTIGNSSINTFRCNTQSISSLSDGRDKIEVEDLPLGLDFIDTLRPIKFKWNTRDGNIKDGSYEAGFIAQDLQSAQSTSNADYLKMVMDENPDRLEAAYGKLIPVLVQAIKDLKSEIETLKSNG
tara:strand:+ start:2138 stop:3235 length:1098 start_codon:yes stop_codon:yes gene_type:complete